MHKNFDICPHCFAKGKDRVIRPATVDTAGVRAESALVQIPLAGSDAKEVLEQAADALAELLARGVPLKRVYAATELRMDGGSTAA